MIGSLPVYVTGLFLLTTLLTIGIFFYAVRSVRPAAFAAGLIAFLVPFWMLVTAILAAGGLYQNFDALPPRVFLFGVMPAVVVIVVYFLFFRRDFIERLPLRALTLVHSVRLPVEICLYLLFANGLIPQIMTFEGRNFDILAGLTSPIVAWLAFRRGVPHRGLLIVWNLLALLLLLNIVVIAFLSFPSPVQRFGLEQPNIGVTYFPFIWLPAVIVPIVFFSHLAALWQLIRTKQ